METDIEETPSQKPPSIVISKPPSIIISENNERKTDKEIKELYQNVVESETNQPNTKKFLIGLFTPGVILILFLLTLDYLEDKHYEWDEEYRDDYYYEFHDYDVPPEPIDLEEIEDEIAIFLILFFIIYILAIIYAFVTGQKDLALGLITSPFLVVILELF